MDFMEIDNLDELNELEARLYAQIHHEVLSGGESNHSYQSNNYQQATEKVTEISVIPNTKNNDNIGVTQNDTPASELDIGENSALENVTTKASVMSSEVNVFPSKDQNTTVNNVDSSRVLPKVQRNKRKVKTQKHPKRTVNGKQRVIEQIAKGIFGQKAVKLEKLRIIKAKKQKSLKARQKCILRQQDQKNEQNQKLGIVKDIDNIIDFDDEDNKDDVIYVPLPAPQVINIVDSDEDLKEENESTEHLKKDRSAFLEENAIDVFDTQLEKTKIITPVKSLQSSICNSPNSSVMSSDDFIGQRDKRRLKGRLCDIQANDEDLFLLNAGIKSTNKIELETQPQTGKKSKPEFLPPSQFKPLKENYRIEPNQFRISDVYESESDITEYGFISKKKETTIQSLDSGNSDNDVQMVEAANVQKIKRPRKRRASNNQKDLDKNIDTNNVDHPGDSLIGRAENTGVPFLRRGPAVERCESKFRKLLQAPVEEHKSEIKDLADTRFIKPLKNISKGDNAMCHNVEHGVQTQAEKVLEQPSTSQSTKKVNKSPRMNKNKSVMNRQTNALDTKENAIPFDTTIEFDKVFKQIDKLTSGLNKLNESNEFSNCVSNQIENKKIPNSINKPDLQTNKTEFLRWNEEMYRFYNDSWNGENINLKQLQRKLNGHKLLWKINLEDRFPKSALRSIKCTNCYETGHPTFKCKRPKRPLVCHICGEQGHKETRCPYAICLGCGHKSELYIRCCNNCAFQKHVICPLCKVRGHSANICPDKWRRYHSTTEPNGKVVSEVRYKTIKYCSVCGNKGHLPEHCRSNRLMEYPISVSEIKSHQKVYRDQEISTENSNLFEFNKLDLANTSFNWTQPLKYNGYYKRFLKAVGLDRTLKHKATGKNEMMQSKKSEYFEDTNLLNPYAQVVRNSHNQLTSINNKKAQNNLMFSENEHFGSVEQCSSNSDEDYVVIDEVGYTDDNESVAIDNDMSNVETNNDVVEEETEQTTSSNVLQSHKVKESQRNSDSDSTYSFSEHYELPTSTTATTALEEIENNSPRKGAHPLDNLPDKILLCNDDSNVYDKNNEQHIALEESISTCSLDHHQTLPTSKQQKELDEDTPCESKIFLERSNIKYLLGPNGTQFLQNVTKTCQVDVRFDLTSCGYALVLFGTPAKQAELQEAIRKECKDVRLKAVEFCQQKPPKRVDVLIRFLRDGISKLLKNLGSADELYNQLKYNENQNSKNGNKLADKKRRLLNMILIGQAGLLNGDTHVDELLKILYKLVYYHQGDENVSLEVREEIEKHWVMVFTPYRHNDYGTLLQLFRKQPVKNRITNLHLDPKLLGHKVLDTATSQDHQRQIVTGNVKSNVSERKNVNCSNNHNNVNTSDSKTFLAPLSPISSSKYRKTQSRNSNKNNNSNKPKFLIPQTFKPKWQRSFKPPITDSRQRVNNNSKLQLSVERQNMNMLEDLGKSADKNKLHRSQQPSKFWSRESMKYLDQCISLTTQPNCLSHLYAAQKKLESGLLSHNDYCVIVKWYNLISRFKR